MSHMNNTLNNLRVILFYKSTKICYNYNRNKNYKGESMVCKHKT